MSAALSFDPQNVKRSDLRLIIRAVKERWPIDTSVRDALSTFCIQAKLTGRNDRIVALANEALTAIEAAKGGDVA